MKPVAPLILDILKRYEIDPKDALWDCHGTWVMYHRHCEIIGAKAGVKYAEPKVLVAEREAAAVLVVGSIGDHSEWSIGEAAVGLNYTVKPKQPGYPFAMAEKRAKDRVILKLVGLSGFVYSEEEADDFKAAPEQKSEPPKEAPKTNGARPCLIVRPAEGWFPQTATAYTREFIETARKLPTKDLRQEHYRLNEAAIKDLRMVSGKAADHLDSQFAELS